jgi:hypothetical protein
MAESDLAEQVKDALDTDAEAFERRVQEEVETILAEIDAGTFDNPQGIVGLEIEFYAVDRGEGPRFTEPADAGTLARVPRRLLEYVGFEKELGLHNAEMSTSPDPLNPHGLRAQYEEVCARLDGADEPVSAEGLRLVSDGLWTIPPEGETAREYLADSVEVDGVRLATNMAASPRYHAMANAAHGAALDLDAPHVHLDADTAMVESLATSIQPHFQVPQARDLPAYFRYALRVAGPLLAVAVNSPFFPPDLYEEGVDPETVLAEGHRENRVDVFESVLNPEDGPEKVRFPGDVDTVEEAVHRIADDETVVPMPVETGDRFDDEFAHFRHKHGTFWRWVRPVFGGASRSAANARIEFRPIPAQPTVRDVISVLAVFAGLMVSLRRREHPVLNLDWETARENFYAAAREGLDADLAWITRNGAETRNTAELYRDLFAHAVEGLESRGHSTDEAEGYVRPLRERVARGTTPADWKRARVRERLDRGDAFADAVHAAQRAYISKQAETLLDGVFVDWLDESGAD